MRKPFAKAPLDGEGAFRFGGRWSSPGIRIAYTSEHLSLAMIEYFVHIDADDPPKDLGIVPADVPDRVSRVLLPSGDLPGNSRKVPAPPNLAAIGDTFAAGRRHAILVIPSAIVPSEMNWLINPAHPESAAIKVHPPEPFQYDARFFT